MKNEGGAIKSVIILFAICIIFSYPVMTALNYVFGLNMDFVQAFVFLVLYSIHIVVMVATIKEVFNDL